MYDTGTRTYILYKLTIKIYIHKYILVFFSRKIFFMLGTKGFVPYLYSHNKNLYNKFEFLEN